MLIEYLLLFKSIHIVGAVAWFGGLFYLVRIFVYHVEAFDKDEPDQSILIGQYQIMESRVYKIICVPGLLITWIFGMLTIAAYMETMGWSWWELNTWFHSKFLLIIFLTGYQHWCKAIMKKLHTGKVVMSSFRTRLFNEVPTILLLGIVLMAVYRNTLNSVYAFAGILIFGIVLYLFARWYKSKRST